MMSLELYLTYVAACVLLAILPGPNVTLVIANGLRHGTRAAMLNIVGTQIGLTIVVVILALGFATFMANAGAWFDWVRFIGAAYLIWLGVKLMREPARVGVTENAPPPPRGGFTMQGFLVLVSNPKVLIFYGAFIPQFVDASGPQVAQILLLGFTFNLAAAIGDTAYALMAGQARTWMSERRARLLSRISGGVMIGGGLWLALTRAR